jgi:hypothetical protein
MLFSAGAETAFVHTQASRVPFEDGTVTRLVKKFPALYGACRFIIVFTQTRQSTVS